MLLAFWKKTNISTVLAGHKPGIKEIDHGIWLIGFMRYDLGYIDLEQRTLQTIDNPFGARLSPMSWLQTVIFVFALYMKRLAPPAGSEPATIGLEGHEEPQRI
nr:hypothetical protein [Martelella lutilitoris]